jgi:enoyl-CoA hydratase
MSSQNPERLQIREAADGVRKEAIKRAIYRVPSSSLELGLHPERTEFLTSLPQRQAQELMIGYLRDSDEHGELGFYASDAYLAAERGGTMSAHTVSPRS